jgi:hypothetical protein
MNAMKDFDSKRHIDRKAKGREAITKAKREKGQRAALVVLDAP